VLVGVSEVYGDVNQHEGVGDQQIEQCQSVPAAWQEGEQVEDACNECSSESNTVYKNTVLNVLEVFGEQQEDVREHYSE